MTLPNAVEIKLDGVERPVPGSVFGDAFYAWVVEALSRGIRPTALRTSSGEMPDGSHIVGWCETEDGGTYLITLDLDVLKASAEGRRGRSGEDPDDDE